MSLTNYNASMVYMTAGRICSKSSLPLGADKVNDPALKAEGLSAAILLDSDKVAAN